MGRPCFDARDWTACVQRTRSNIVAALHNNKGETDVMGDRPAGPADLQVSVEP